MAARVTALALLLCARLTAARSQHDLDASDAAFVAWARLPAPARNASVGASLSRARADSLAGALAAGDYPALLRAGRALRAVRASLPPSSSDGLLSLPDEWVSSLATVEVLDGTSLATAPSPSGAVVVDAASRAIVLLPGAHAALGWLPLLGDGGDGGGGDGAAFSGDAVPVAGLLLRGVSDGIGAPAVLVADAGAFECDAAPTRRRGGALALRCVVGGATVDARSRGHAAQAAMEQR